MTPTLKFVIAYPNDLGGVSLIYPASTCELSIKDIAEKDVPEGVPYMFIPSKAVPEDHTFFDAFEVDFSTPSGYGIGAAAWFAKQNTSEENNLQ